MAVIIKVLNQLERLFTAFKFNFHQDSSPKNSQKEKKIIEEMRGKQSKKLKSTEVFEGERICEGKKIALRRRKLEEWSGVEEVN